MVAEVAFFGQDSGGARFVEWGFQSGDRGRHPGVRAVSRVMETTIDVTVSPKAVCKRVGKRGDREASLESTAVLEK